MNLDSELTIRGLVVHAVDVPMNRPLKTGGGEVGSAAMVLIDLLTEEGVTGCSYLFCPTPLVLKPLAKLLSNLAHLIEGDLLAPFEIERKLQKTFRLLGPQGLSAMAIAGIDIGAWDALAKSCEMSLVRLLGGRSCRIPAYNSCGLGMIGPERAAEEAEELLAAALEDEGLYWIEEPTRADDYSGHAQIRRDSNTPVQIGENWWGPHDAAKSIEARASDYVMPDAMNIGGVTGWLRTAALAEAAGIPLSSHLFPEISSHLLAVSPTRHWLEYVDWAAPILEKQVKIEDGYATTPDAAGIGISWDVGAVQRYSVGEP